MGISRQVPVYGLIIRDMRRREPSNHFQVIILASLVLACLINLGGCATRGPETYNPPPPEFALPAKMEGTFYPIESAIRENHGPEASGFELLDTNEEGLRWRLALIDSATYSLDVQYYLWYGDAAGRIFAKRLLDAADRGVKVRVIVDDLNTLLTTASRVALRDTVVAWLDAHPHVEIRLFNPWSNRAITGRLGESVAELERVNQRMHNKVMIVDNRATIIGGRNIGDEYMGLNPSFNFHDLDVLGIGPVARQASTVFDAYWNSEWVMPVSALQLQITPGEQSEGRRLLMNNLDEATSLAQFSLLPRTWSNELAELQQRLHFGTSRVESDLPRGPDIDHVMLNHIHDSMAAAKRELLIVNAYIIPTDQGIDRLRELEDRGVHVSILTNSLASHDVPAVNSHYKNWRKPILAAGADLYELRHDGQMRQQVADTAPTRARFMGLHSKAMVVDRSSVFIGSMNYDPRSALFNTEMGVFIESDGLGTALAALIKRDIQPQNSWQVELEKGKSLIWKNDREIVSRQPARNWWQRVEDIFFMGFPKELY